MKTIINESINILDALLNLINIFLLYVLRGLKREIPWNIMIYFLYHPDVFIVETMYI